MREVIRRKKGTVLGSGMCVVAVMALALLAWSPNQADAAERSDSITDVEILQVPGLLGEVRASREDTLGRVCTLEHTQETTAGSAWAPSNAHNLDCHAEYADCLANHGTIGWCQALFALCEATRDY